MLYVVGFGCGNREGMTFAAYDAIERSDLVIGYSTYIDLIRQIFPDKPTAETGMRKERERVASALAEAQTKTVALVCSGDPELYGMAGLALEMQPNYPDAEIEIVAGVSAAFSGGAILGAPLTHDLAVISLSDLLTPAEIIARRLRSAAEGDFVIVLYNPSSKHRPEHLKKACDILLSCRPPETVCGIVRNIGRAEQSSRILTLGELRETAVDMFTTVYIGNSETVALNGKMVTPRGYRNG